MHKSSPERHSALRPALVGAGAARCVMRALGAAPRTQNKVPNLPNASAQRLAMIDAIEKLDGRLEKLEKLLSEGKLVVKISELPEITVAE